MLDGRFIGSILLLAGSVLLLLPLEPGSLLHAEDAASAGLALVALGLCIAILAWRTDIALAPSGMRDTWRRISASLVQRSPAKRMKIRIRCAR